MSGVVRVIDPARAALTLVLVLWAPLNCGGGGGTECGSEDTSAGGQEEQCALTAEADWFVTSSMPLPANKVVDVPYSNPACPNRFVAEIDLSRRVLRDLYYARGWPRETLRTEEECQDAIYSVAVYRKIEVGAGAWETEPFDRYKFGGVWEAGVCNAKNLDGGFIGPGEVNTEVGYPVGWIDVSEQDSGLVQAVRLIIDGRSECQQKPFAVQFRATL